MALTLLRHTQPDVAPGTCYGRTDLALAGSFSEEAESVLLGLPAIDRIVSSPLGRCARLAEFVAARTGLDVVRDERLVEMDFGAWEMRPWRDLPRHELDAWATDFLHARPHGGESVAMLTERTQAAITQLGALDGHTLIVTHAGVIKAVFAAAGGHHHYRSAVAYGGLITLLDQTERPDAT